MDVFTAALNKTQDILPPSDKKNPSQAGVFYALFKRPV
jgi:hypothetical protein